MTTSQQFRPTAHISNLLPPHLVTSYNAIVSERFQAFVKSDKDELIVNVYGELVLHCLDGDKDLSPRMRFKPIVKNGVLHVMNSNVEIQQEHICSFKDCGNAYFGNTTYKKGRKSRMVCRKHFKLDLLNIQKRDPKGNRNDPFNMEEDSDENGVFKHVGIRNRIGITTDHIRVDSDHIAFLSVNRPRWVDKYIRVNYTRPDGEKCCSVLLHRILLAKSLFGIYDHRLIPELLVVDHLDGRVINNRIHNLRITTPWGNHLNTDRFRNMISIGTFFGYGTDKMADGSFKIKAYKIVSPGIAKVQEETTFKDITKGLEWKRKLEEKWLQEQGLLKYLETPFMIGKSASLLSA